jgi:hypothetical protein
MQQLYPRVIRDAFTALFLDHNLEIQIFKNPGFYLLPGGLGENMKKGAGNF